MNILTLFILGLLLVFGCSPRRPPPVPYNELTKEHFKHTAAIEDDSLATTAMISTSQSADTGMSDNYIRALVEKNTGKTVYQVVNEVVYDAQNWRFYHAVNYETPSGPESNDLIVMLRDLACRSSGLCRYVEAVTFIVEPELLKGIQMTFSPGANQRWNYKLIAKRGADLFDYLSYEEITGLLERVDEYQKTLAQIQR